MSTTSKQLRVLLESIPSWPRYPNEMREWSREQIEDRFPFWDLFAEHNRREVPVLHLDVWVVYGNGSMAVSHPGCATPVSQTIAGSQADKKHIVERILSKKANVLPRPDLLEALVRTCREALPGAGPTAPVHIVRNELQERVASLAPFVQKIRALIEPAKREVKRAGGDPCFLNNLLNDPFIDDEYVDAAIRELRKVPDAEQILEASAVASIRHPSNLAPDRMAGGWDGRSAYHGAVMMVYECLAKLLGLVVEDSDRARAWRDLDALLLYPEGAGQGLPRRAALMAQAIEHLRKAVTTVTDVRTCARVDAHSFKRGTANRYWADIGCSSKHDIVVSAASAILDTQAESAFFRNRVVEAFDDGISWPQLAEDLLHEFRLASLLPPTQTTRATLGRDDSAVASAVTGPKPALDGTAAASPLSSTSTPEDSIPTIVAGSADPSTTAEAPTATHGSRTSGEARANERQPTRSHDEALPEVSARPLAVDFVPVEKAIGLLLRDGRNPRSTRSYAKDVGVSHSTLGRNPRWKQAIDIAQAASRNDRADLPPGEKDVHGSMHVLALPELCDNCRQDSPLLPVVVGGDPMKLCETCARKHR